jgi:ubiquinone/menaquinone biosynthesis C-methylase UbiE
MEAGKVAHICPWWRVYTFDNPIRRLVHDPAAIFGPYVSAGMTAVDVGCGGGFTTLGLARLVGASGRVIAVDVQEKMLAMVRRRARRAGLSGRITTHQCTFESLGIEDEADFADVFWMAHEVQDRERFFGELHALLRPGGRLLVTEPVRHVSREGFDEEVAQARDAGFRRTAEPQVRFSRAALLERD